MGLFLNLYAVSLVYVSDKLYYRGTLWYSDYDILC